jgi:hypothetical protein
MCSLQLLLGIASEVFLGSEYPRDPRTYFAVSNLRLPQPGGPGSCIYFPQEQGGPVIPSDIGYPALLGNNAVSST